MKKRRGASEPSPGGRFPRSPLAEVGHRRPFFRRHVVVLLCGWDASAPRGRRRPSGARESLLFRGGCFNQDISKIQKNVTTTLAYYIIRISLTVDRRGARERECVKHYFCWRCTCVALPTKQIMRYNPYNLYRQIILKPGFGQNTPTLGHSAFCTLSPPPSSPLNPSNDTPRPKESHQVMI